MPDIAAESDCSSSIRRSHIYKSHRTACTSYPCWLGRIRASPGYPRSARRRPKPSPPQPESPAPTPPPHTHAVKSSISPETLRQISPRLVTQIPARLDAVLCKTKVSPELFQNFSPIANYHRVPQPPGVRRVRFFRSLAPNHPPPTKRHKNLCHSDRSKPAPFLRV